MTATGLIIRPWRAVTTLEQRFRALATQAVAERYIPDCVCVCVCVCVCACVFLL